MTTHLTRDELEVLEWLRECKDGMTAEGLSASAGMALDRVKLCCLMLRRKGLAQCERRGEVRTPSVDWLTHYTKPTLWFAEK
jgi:hypothetical protein